jgi:hypothetical protein
VLLHTLATTAIDDIGIPVFPLICDETPAILGPNYEISFGDRSIETVIEIPNSFERSQGSVSNPWAEINTPQHANSRDPKTRNAVICSGIESILRSNGYDGIEDEITKLPEPT